jgi:hypothetical protein
MFKAFLDYREAKATIDWIADHQGSDGAIPWFPGDKLDPWDHIECAMALTVCNRFDSAKSAFRYLKTTQGADGAWPSAIAAGEVIDPTRDSNHAAYLATGLWHLHRAHGEVDFLAEMWPTLDRAISFVLRLQDESGAIWWAVDGAGKVWPAPLVAGSSSIHGSLVCAARIAELLGHQRPHWPRARQLLAGCLRDEHEVFHTSPVAEPPGRFSMDWYYPILGGAVRGEGARERLARDWQVFLGDAGWGCRCVRERPWYTVAETCELVIALDACGMTREAHALYDWVHTLREEDGGYWTGITTQPERLYWPEERPTWTSAAVILAADVLAGQSPTSGFFRELAGE